MSEFIKNITKVTLDELRYKERQGHLKMEQLLSDVQEIDINIKELRKNIEECESFLGDENG